MKKYITLVLLMAFLMGGCSATQQQYAINSMLTSSELSTLSKDYERVEMSMRIAQKERQIFSDDEWRSLLNVDAIMDMSITKYAALMRFDKATLNINDVTFMWGMTVEGYKEARGVIMAHWDEFDTATQLHLNSFDTKAELTSERINELLTNPSNSSINEALTLMAGILSITVKMLSVAII